MSFINKSVYFSQTVLLKNLLKPQLVKYNNHVTNLCRKPPVTKPEEYFIIPNNNKKFYLFIIPKLLLEQTKEDYNILYFFPDQASKNAFESNKTISNTLYDFCVEIDNKFCDSFLFEGYMYNGNDITEYLITDILVKNNEIVIGDFAFRYSLLTEMFSRICPIDKINNHLSIGIHPVFSSENENLGYIFNNNFMYKNELCCIEKIYANKKEIIMDTSKIKQTTQECLKIIEKDTSNPDVYTVLDIETKNHQGILYVKGLQESNALKSLFAEKQTTILKCVYNITFNKWQPNKFENYILK